MSDPVDSFGAPATAGLAAHAVTPAVALDASHAPCANCATPGGGRFCSHCGQAAHVHRSLMHVGEEFLHGLTHFDGKAWQTLPLLLVRPGKLTRDYVYGHRARHVPPVALFLLTVFLMFFAFSFVEVTPASVGAPIGKTRAERLAQAAEARRDAQSTATALATTDAQLADARAKGDAQRAGELAADRAMTAAAADVARQLAARAELAVDHPAAAAPVKLDLLDRLRVAVDRGDLKVRTGGLPIDSQLRHTLANPELALNKLEQKAYKFSFLLIPLSLPWLWLMFAWRRDVHLYDHAVFTLYSLSFISLLLVVSVLLVRFAGADPGTLAGFAVLIVPLHVFAQLKGAYRLGVAGAVWRTGFLMLGAALSLSLFAAAVVLLGLVD